MEGRARQLPTPPCTGIEEGDLALARTSQETRFFNEVKQLVERRECLNQQVVDGAATLLHVAAANSYVQVRTK